VGRDFGPSQRFTMTGSNIDGSTENIVLGESGNPLSPYFRDQWNNWYGGTTFAFPFTFIRRGRPNATHAAATAVKPAALVIMTAMTVDVKSLSARGRGADR